MPSFFKPFAHWRRTGQKLPHEHTSYAGLAFITLLAGAILAAFTTRSLAFGPDDPGPYSDTHGFVVTAIVSGGPPTVAPTIDTPTNSQHFTNNPIVVSPALATAKTN